MPLRLCWTSVSQLSCALSINCLLLTMTPWIRVSTVLESIQSRSYPSLSQLSPSKILSSTPVRYACVCVCAKRRHATPGKERDSKAKLAVGAIHELLSSLTGYSLYYRFDLAVTVFDPALNWNEKREQTASRPMWANERSRGKGPTLSRLIAAPDPAPLWSAGLSGVLRRGVGSRAVNNQPMVSRRDITHIHKALMPTPPAACPPTLNPLSDQLSAPCPIHLSLFVILHAASPQTPLFGKVYVSNLRYYSETLQQCICMPSYLLDFLSNKIMLLKSIPLGHDTSSKTDCK